MLEVEQPLFETRPAAASRMFSRITKRLCQREMFFECNLPVHACPRPASILPRPWWCIVLLPMTTDAVLRSMPLYVNVERIHRELTELGIGGDATLRPEQLFPFDQYHYNGVDAVRAA